jgi:hypothetical protein
MPACDQVGTPAGLLGLIHLRSSTMSGSAAWIRRRISARVVARQSTGDRGDSSPRREAAPPVTRFVAVPGPVFARAFDIGADLVAGLPARDLFPDFGFGFIAMIYAPA